MTRKYLRLKNHSVDKRALKLLLKYDPLAALYAARPATLDARKAKYVAEHGTSPEDFQYMKDHGLAYEPVSMTHDEAVRQCFAHFDAARKKQCTDLFLSGLGRKRNDWRSGLSAFAIMQTFPDHRFEANKAGFCSICSGAEQDSRLDLTGLNGLRFAFGSLAVARTPYEIWFFLKQLASDEAPEPEPADVSLFKATFDCIRNVAPETTPLELVKILKQSKTLGLSNDELRFFIETLGFCGILESPEHPGYLTRYTNPGSAPSKTHGSNWAYPVDFWVGRHGVNPEALKFWFGDYGDLLKGG